LKKLFYQIFMLNTIFAKNDDDDDDNEFQRELEAIKRSEEARKVDRRYGAVVIGAGWAGLGTAASLRHSGVEDFVVLEKGDQVGYFWSTLWNHLRMNSFRHELWNTPREMTAEMEDYKPKSEVMEYLNAYTDHFEIRKHIQFNSEVKKIRRTSFKDEGNDEFWVVEMSDGSKIGATNLAVATGLNRLKYVPNIPGIRKYGGNMLHSGQYQDPRDFPGRTLVVGCGNSAVEIAGDIAAESKENHVTLLVREGRHFVKEKTKLWWERLFAFCGAYTESFFLDDYRTCRKDLRYHEQLASPWQGSLSKLLYETDMSDCGIERPKTPILANERYYGKLMVIDKGAIQLIQEGLIEVANENVSHITKTGVEWEDGQREDFDNIILGTGYRHGLERMFESRLWNQVSDVCLQIPTAIQQRFQLENYRTLPYPDTDGRSQNPTYPSLFFPGFDLGITGGISMGIYAWDVGERIAVRLGCLPEGERTVHSYRTITHKKNPLQDAWTPRWKEKLADYREAQYAPANTFRGLIRSLITPTLITTLFDHLNPLLN